METPSASTPAVPPTRHAKTTGHHPTPSALLDKTTKATTKTSTAIRTSPSSSSTPVAPSTPDASRYTCPQNLEPNYQTFTYRDHCYQFVTKEDWRSTAREYCRKYQGHLIEIPDQSTMDFVIDVLNKKLKWGVNGVWNGATDQREEGVWEWDGSDNPVIYSNWAQGQPGGLARWTEDCACMRRTDNWQWHDYGCSQPGYSYRYICQYDLVENITTNSLLLSTQTVTPRLESTSKTKQQSLPPTALISKAPLSANRTTPKKPLSTRTTIRTITAKQSPSISRKPSSSSYHQTSVTTPSSTPTSVKSSTSRTNPQIDVSPFPVQGRTCPQTLGTEHKTVVYNGSYCYQFVDKSVTWNDALDYCQRRGGALVEIYGQETMDFIAEVLRRNFSWNAVWIGASDEEKEGEFKWRGSGREVTYSNWAPGQPSGIWTLGLEDCVALEKADGYKWHDYHCSIGTQKLKLICQYDLVEKNTPSVEQTSIASATKHTPTSATSGYISTTTTTSETPTDTPITGSLTTAAMSDTTCPPEVRTNERHVYGGQCYQFVDRAVTWVGALNDCEVKGGRLLEIYDEDTMRFIARTLTNYYRWDTVWTGANDRGKEGQFIWRGTGWEVTYTNWAPAQPSGIWAFGLEDCVALVKNDGYKWHDFHCNIGTQQFRFICQYGPLPTTSPSVPLTSSLPSQSSRKGEVTSTTSSPRTMLSQSSRKGEVTSTSTLPQTTAVDTAKGPLSLKNQDEHGVSSSNNKGY
ncbi:macrophage mannose receptor 1-like [Lingula anatina]|uniref:Macrophage mannose receptor 1-like n=1 Tax=Lingula anatina TaxID=7574 RepID=A0A1S3ICP2_LINAN|nr:macrophage mannose receptor 1-like [Lingula anatina]|eukprot:XP_013395626.1 macrophage mannose receptor 1-like [Lingula anatina]